jgi:GT2 family glycosyltransferase/glycosyltransferase involved in cell wall biosynthesis
VPLDIGKIAEPESPIAATQHLHRLLQCATAAIAAGDLDAALRHADRAARIAPEAAPALLAGRLLLARGDAAAAVRLLERAVRSRPNAENAAWLARARLAAGQTDAAVTEIAAALHRFAVAPEGPIPAATRALAGPDIVGWIGVSAALELIGEVFDPEATMVTIIDAAGEIRARRRIGRRARRPAPFRIAPPPDVGRRVLTARTESGELLGSGLTCKPDFDVDGRAVIGDGGLSGWVSLGWSPSLLSEVTVEDERGSRIRAPVERDPADPDRGRFALDLRDAGLTGNRIGISVPLPDGGSAPLPGTPLLLELPPAQKRRRLPGQGLPRLPARRRPVDVVIPVYLGREETLACIASVLASCGRGARIVLIDDGSPDPHLSAALADLADREPVILLRNPQNEGFPAAANRGLTLNREHDVVLLNADTLVHGDWLERLRAAAYRAPDIGTATPLSNRGSIASYPAGDDYECSAAEGRALDALAADRNAGAIVDLPTGVGFCLYLRRDCLDQVGLFDAQTFASGYGEENDFCMRARELGWRHVLAADVFVAHGGARSFGRRRDALMERNGRLLNLRYPHYDELVAAFLAADPLHAIRRRLDEARLTARHDPHVLLVAPNVTGGVERFVRERCRAIRDCGEVPIVLRPHAPGSGSGAGSPAPGCRLDVDRPLCRDLFYALPDDLAALQGLLSQLRIAHVELHHFLGHDARTIAAVIGLGVPRHVYIHDNGWICPRLTLLGGDGVYCGEPDIAGCEACIERHGSALGEPISVAELRARSAGWLAAADTVIVPSADAAGRLGRHFTLPALRVEPWEADVARDVTRGELAPLVPARPVRVAVIGAIGEQKGYKVLLACAQDAARRRLPLEFVVIGFTADDQALFDTGKVFVTGPYEEPEIHDLLRREAPRVAFFPSVTPETWCYALTPALRNGLPIVAFDLGAISERLRAAGIGMVVPVTTGPDQLNDLLLSAAGEDEPMSTIVREPAPESGDDELPSSVRLMTIAEGLYAFLVRAGAPVPGPMGNGLLFPAVHVQPAPGEPSGAVEFMTGPRANGNWLCRPGDMLIARVSGRPATLLLTSVRAVAGPPLSIEVERLDNRTIVEGAGPAIGEENGGVSLPAVGSQFIAQPERAIAEPLDIPAEIVVHIQRQGDRTFTGSAWAGYVGQRLWVEAFSVRPLERFAADQIEYKGLAATGYETPWLSNGALCGSRGMATPLLGFAVRAKAGAPAAACDFEYSGAFLSGATIGPKRNGEPCISSMPSDPLEAIRLRILPRAAADARAGQNGEGAR